MTNYFEIFEDVLSDVMYYNDMTEIEVLQDDMDNLIAQIEDRLDCNINDLPEFHQWLDEYCYM